MDLNSNRWIQPCSTVADLEGVTLRDLELPTAAMGWHSQGPCDGAHQPNMAGLGTFFYTCHCDLIAQKFPKALSQGLRGNPGAE